MMAVSDCSLAVPCTHTLVMSIPTLNCCLLFVCTLRRIDSEPKFFPYCSLVLYFLIEDHATWKEKRVPLIISLPLFGLRESTLFAQ